MSPRHCLYYTYTVSCIDLSCKNWVKIQGCSGHIIPHPPLCQGWFVRAFSETASQLGAFAVLRIIARLSIQTNFGGEIPLCAGLGRKTAAWLHDFAEGTYTYEVRKIFAFFTPPLRPNFMHTENPLPLSADVIIELPRSSFPRPPLFICIWSIALVMEMQGMSDFTQLFSFSLAPCFSTEFVAPAAT